MKSSPATPIRSPRHAGPPLLLPALAYTVLLLAAAFTLSAVFQLPRGSGQSAVAHLGPLMGRLAWGSFFGLGSSVPLAIFVATTVSRLHFLGIRAAGATIALAGGIVAAGMLLLSSLALSSLTRFGLAGEDGAIRLLQSLGFAAGGPGFVVPLGLFVAGVSIAAGLHRLIPRWTMIFGLVIAVGCELASLTLVLPIMEWCIPFGRFLSVVWMIAVAVCLPSRLPADPAAPASAA